MWSAPEVTHGISVLETPTSKGWNKTGAEGKGKEYVKFAI